MSISHNNINGVSFNPDEGDFLAGVQDSAPVVVWNISGTMCVTGGELPIYITREQAKRFFNLVEPVEVSQ